MCHSGYRYRFSVKRSQNGWELFSFYFLFLPFLFSFFLIMHLTFIKKALTETQHLPFRFLSFKYHVEHLII